MMSIDQPDFLRESRRAGRACAVNYHLNRSEVKHKENLAITLKYYKALMAFFNINLILSASVR